MNLEFRMTALARLGDHIDGLLVANPEHLFESAVIENPWFTRENVIRALSGIRKMLTRETLTTWTNSYTLQPAEKRNIGVVMAGNIPLVGFHDLLCVLLSGHKVIVKLSSKDSVLPRTLVASLIKIEPRMDDFILFSDRLKQIDALIATGSDNTARYFEYYFRNVPRIIRKNRTSIAILRHDETDDQLEALGVDVFSYFGLGCRNVSKLFIPVNYDVKKVLDAWKRFDHVRGHSKYFNNYEYQKSILLVNKTEFHDNGFILLKNDTGLVSPVSILYCENFEDARDLHRKVESHAEKIQCVVSAGKWFPESEAFGQAQFPNPWDYADKVDTMKFLDGLS